MEVDRDGLRDTSEGDRERSEPSEHRWAVGGDRTCDHVGGDPVTLGTGGLYHYARCLRCDAVVVERVLG